MEAGYHDRLKSARTVAVRYPWGRPFGREHDAANQRVTLEECFELLEMAREPTLRRLPYRWRREDWEEILRARRRTAPLSRAAGG